MNIKTLTQNPGSLVCDLLILPFFEHQTSLEPHMNQIDQALGGQITSVFAQKDFTGKRDNLLLLPIHGRLPAARLLLVGLGKRTLYDLETLRRAIGLATQHTKPRSVKDVAIFLPQSLSASLRPEDVGQAIIDALLTSRYVFTKFKKSQDKNEHPAPLSNVTILCSNPKNRSRLLRGALQGLAVAEAVNYTRDLSNHPGNLMTPQSLAQEARALAKSTRISCTVLGKKQIEKLGMGALLGVNQGSALPPEFIILEYRGKRTVTPYVLVGKGITFDSGGISIKPSRNMEEMKFDGAGAAACLGIVKAANNMRLPVHLVGLIPATENLPSGSAIKPGDVVTALSGKTIEVINTDAEGRMILADALAYASRYKPKAVIDFATLAGAMVVALGPEYTGVFASSTTLMKRLQAASARSGEKVWPFPLPEGYKEQLKSHVADLKNVGNDGAGGGAITAALFLQEFVSYPWIHLDIAGTAWMTAERAGYAAGATGVGVRLMLEYLR